MQERTDEDKKKLVKQWQESGKTKTLWCQENGIMRSIFYGWIIKFLPPKASSLLKEHFVELKNRASLPTEIEIRFQNYILLISKNFDPDTLRLCLNILKSDAC